MKKKLALAVSFALAAAFSSRLGLSKAYAVTHKVDCSQVMTELQAGKKVSEVAKEMKVSKSSVYRCRREAKAAAAASPGAMGSPAMMASPAAMGSPAAAPMSH